MTISQAFTLALERHQAGYLADAETLYLQILAAQPRHPGALHHLGVIAHQAGRHELAIDWIRQALSIDPTVAAAHSNLGEALRLLGRLDDATAAYREALALQPEWAEVHNNLALALEGQGKLEESAATFEHALRLRPDYPEALSNLGNVLRNLGRLDDAVASFRRALQLRPAYPEALSNLGNALRERGQFDDAVAVYRQAIQLRPHFAEACSNLGVALAEQGQLRQALDAHRQALALQPQNARAHSNLIYRLYYDPEADARAIAEEAERWNKQFAAPLRRALPVHPNSRDPSRHLRIGYVSPDFRWQAECHFVAPLLEAHDHAQFEIHCYASVARPDAMTARLRQAADRWHDVLGLSDEQLAAKIRADEIDILVDLTMHMARHRLLVFARKPAPLQVAWLAYPGSTGLDSMDYRLTDERLDPSDVPTPFYSEQSIHLPDSWCCYDPLADGPPVNGLPAGEGSTFTFGCLNHFWKINDQTIALFASVLNAIGNARLMLLVPEGSARSRICEQFRGHGIKEDRLILVSAVPRADYLRRYHEIDIALDPLPYNGITTTCDSLWMGVPVVSLLGKTAAGRAGLSLLSTAGFPELAVQTAAEFVTAAERLARDRPALAHLRARLRSQLETSPLMDRGRFARHVEAAYRTIWRQRCDEAVQ